jgi:hypothetical protein
LLRDPATGDIASSFDAADAIVARLGTQHREAFAQLQL